MALQNITNVSISLEDANVTRAGFGTPLFIGAHRWFNERIRTYSDIDEVAEDIPTDANEYIAATAFFSQSPAPTQIKIGRRETNAVLTPAAPSEYLEYTVTVKDQDGDSVVVTVVADLGDDEEAIVDAIKAAIDGDANVSPSVTTTKNGTGANATLTIAPAGASNSFSISTLSNLTYSYTTPSETAATVLAAIEAVDSDFYFITANDHTEAFVLALAAAVETREKIYFVSSQATGILSALADPATDIFGKLKELNYFRTVALFHNTADTTFPECAFVGRGAPYDPGTITWANKRLAGVSASKDPSTGLTLSSTQQNNVASRNANFIQSVGGIDITREGKVVAGEWIDIIRSRDLIRARITEAYQNKIINSGKIPYTDAGINSMRSVLVSVLSQYVSTANQPNILREANPFTTNFPKAASVSDADKQNRLLNASFVGYLAGAIHIVSITGKLTEVMG